MTSHRDRPGMSLRRALEVNTSLLASTLAGWRGTAAFQPATRQPQQPLQLYEFEACPHCRLVREALTEMDLDALVRPCPKNGRRFRPEAQRLGGKLQLPFLIDPNTGTRLHGSAEIVEHLARTYGARAAGLRGIARSLRLTSARAAGAPRLARGLRARASRAPAQALELYSFESSPYSRLVREVLCELELPYLLRSTGKALWRDMGPPWVRARLFEGTPIEGRNRRRLHELTGRVQLPCLIDPNTGITMFESADIVAYLNERYAA